MASQLMPRFSRGGKTHGSNDGKEVTFRPSAAAAVVHLTGSRRAILSRATIPLGRKVLNAALDPNRLCHGVCHGALAPIRGFSAQ